MKIVIDARLYLQSGVGRYLQKLIDNLAAMDKENKYIIYLNKDSYSSFTLPSNNIQKKLVNIPWHSFQEQILLPLFLLFERADLVHFPYFSVPLFYPGKFIVTIHDLIIDHFDTGRASTRSPLTYKLKRFSYRLTISQAVRRAQKIIAVSKSTKKEIVSHYRINPEKIVVIYEAADFNQQPVTVHKPLISSPYLLYVGNAYPHKNLERLISAFKLLKKDFNQLKLVLVGKKDFFYQRLEKKLNPLQKENIIIFGLATDKQLINLYRYASAFVFPSLMEGFGLPGLEAMAARLPVVAADIPALKEIYGQAVLYFDPQNPAQIAEKIVRILKNEDLAEKLRKAGRRQVQKYSWFTMAKQTRGVYESCLGI